MRIEETGYGSTLTKEAIAAGMNIAAADAKLLLEVFIGGIVEKLSAIRNNKNKTKTSIRVTDLKGNFLIGFACDYHEPEEDSVEDTGNWSLISSFNEEDIKCQNIKEVQDNSVLIVIDQYAGNHHRIAFINAEYLKKLIIVTFESLVNYLRANAKDTVETIEIENIGIIKFVKENDTVKMSIDLDGSLKRLIKDDAVLAQ